MRKYGLLLMLALAIALAPAAAKADAVGCCSNPGAGPITCTNERLVLRDAECCPTPESGFGSYYKPQNPNGPANSAECKSSFFSLETPCSQISACSGGCCCSELGGAITSEAQCKGSTLKFYKGETDCQKVCPSPQCNDGID